MRFFKFLNPEILIINFIKRAIKMIDLLKVTNIFSQPGLISAFKVGYLILLYS